MLQRLLALLFLAVAVLASPAAAQGVDTGHLQAQLVHQTQWAAPGSTVHIALVQDIDEGWHTYWTNPGDTGQATALDWTPAPGVRIGEPVWPTPERILTEAGADRFMSYAYQGRVVTPVPVEVPAWARPGDSLNIQVAATFYVCSDTLCIPEDARLSLELPVREGRPPLDGRWGSVISQTLAAAPQHGAVEATAMLTGGVLTLSFAGEDLAEIDADGAYFLPAEAGVIHQAAVQRVERGTRGLTLSVPVNERLLVLTRPIEGVLATRAGSWRVSAEPGRPLPGSTGRGPAEPAPLQGALGQPAGGLGALQALAFAFLGGLILNIMPCVFPILSMKAASLAKAAARPASARLEGLAFLAGVLATFLVLAGLLLVLRAGGEAIGWGFQLQSPAVVAVLALVMLAAGLNLSGLYHVGASAQRLGQDAAASLEGPLARLRPWAGSALTGVLAVVVAAPCTAPFMAAAIGYAVTQPAWLALAVFAALGLGFAAPFVLISFTPRLLRALPRPGPWLGRAKAVLALPMYGAAMWLAWVFLRQAGAGPTAWLAVAALGAGLALWLYGRRQTAEMEGWRRPPAAAVIAGVAVLAVAGPAQAPRGPPAARSSNDAPPPAPPRAPPARGQAPGGGPG
uniref:protein-disulfide reductase DsbD domain-containing protein n=1 Tax=Brevundimonas sp. TaxID=1871086 RepID=UPI0025F8D316